MSRAAVTALIGAALLAGACQTPQPTPARLSPAPAAATLAPARLPVLESGATFVFRKRDGAEVTSRVVAVEGEDVTWQADNGWTWTGKAFFWPVERWQGESTGGSQEISGDPQALLPLTVGERVAYRYQGRRDDNQAGWSGRGCHPRRWMRSSSARFLWRPRARTRRGRRR